MGQELAVELEFRLRTRRPDDRHPAVCHDLQDIPGELIGFTHKGSEARLVPVINHIRNGKPTKLPGRRLAQRAHKPVSAQYALRPAHHDRSIDIRIAAQLFQDVDIVVEQRLSLLAELLIQGGEVQADRRGVFIFEVRDEHTAVALLDRQDQLLGRTPHAVIGAGPVQGLQDRRHIFEADEQVVHDPGIARPSHDLAQQPGGHQGLNDQPSALRTSGVQHQEIAQHGRELVAVKMIPAAVGQSGLKPHPVRIRVTGEDQADPVRIGKGFCRLGRLGDFGVGHAKRNGRKSPVRALVGRSLYREPDSLQQRANRRQPTAAQGRKHDRIGRQRSMKPVVELHIGPEVFLVQPTRNGTNQVLAQGLRKGDGANVRGLRHDIHQPLVVRGYRLAAMLVIHLDAVIVGRIMRGRQINAPDRAQLTNQIGQLRRGQHGRVVFRLGEIGDDAVPGVNLTRQFTQRSGRHAQKGVGVAQEAVHTSQVVKHPDIVGHHHSQIGPVRKY